MSKRTALGAMGLGLAAGTALGVGAAKQGHRLVSMLRGASSGAASGHVPKAAAVGAPQTGLSLDPSRYPSVRRDESVVEVLHGVSVADPYRWLEDPDAEETQQFVAAQNALTQEMLAQCDTRDAFKQLFTKLYDYPKWGTPFKRGRRYYYYHNSGLQQQYVLYGQDSLDAEASVVLDPNTLSTDGTVSLQDVEFCDDGSIFSYTTSSGGADWVTIQVMDVDASGAVSPRPDKLEYIKHTSMAWTHDNAGFFYNKYPQPKNADLGTETDINTNQLLCYHVLGEPQSEDCELLAFPDHPTWLIGASVTDDGRYVMLYIMDGCRPTNMMYLVDVQALTERLPNGNVNWKAYDINKGRTKLPLIKLVDNFDGAYSYVANEGTRFVFKTNLNAPRYKVVQTDIAQPSPPATWKDLVPHHDTDVLRNAQALQGDNLICRYLRDAKGAVQLRSLSTGAVKMEVALPGVGTVTGVSGDRKSTECFFSFISFVEPGATYRLDASKPDTQPVLFRRTELSVPHDPQEFETKQVFVPSRDGVRIPMFITHRKGLTLDGSAPTLLYGYGGFNVPMEPGFSASRLAFMHGYNGVFCQANLRGGGEYGLEWRDAGSKANKQNVFNDFQACAEYLFAAGYCSPAKLTIQGGSNGGLLVAACANQRPDLYACVLGQVGVMDMLRFHKFTIGHAWCTDYGSPDIKEEFDYILPYSPLHNVAAPKGGSQQYPAMMLATGDHDDRVVPLHSLKLAATLQHTLVTSQPGTTKQRNPLLIRVEVRAGHGAGKPTAKIIEEASDLFGFAAKCMNAKWVEKL